MKTKLWNALFISDVHLGWSHSNPEYLLNFLEKNDANTIYLLGDIFDFWVMKRSFYWSKSHNRLVKLLLKKARKCNLVFIPGNHDEELRHFCGWSFGNIEVKHEFIHKGIDGQKFLLVHGDEFDLIIKEHRWLEWLGNHAYNLLRTLWFIIYELW